MNKFLERVESLRPSTPWQRIADSPVTKNYTDWSEFEKALGLAGKVDFVAPRGGWDLVLGPCGGGKTIEIDESLLDPSASRLYVEHLARSRTAYFLDLASDEHLSAALCEPVGTTWTSQHVIVNVEPGARASLAIYAPRRAPGTTGIEVRVKKDARLRLAVIYDAAEAGASALILRRALSVGADVVSLTLSRGGLMTRVDEVSIMSSSSRLSHSSAGIVANGRLDNVVDTIQLGHDSDSYVSGLGVALGRSLVAVRGTSVIGQEAARSSSRFFVEALLVGDEARAYTMPMMRIDTGEVSMATHRSAQYRIPADELFYLETRGLSEAEATYMIVRGRVEGAVGVLDDQRLREIAWSVGEGWLAPLLQRPA